MLIRENISQEIRGKAAEVIAKFWMVIASIIITINLFIVLTLIQIAPKLTVLAQPLSSPMESLDLIKITPFTNDFEDKKLIDELLIRYYLENRYITFSDEYEMNRRWKNVVRLLSSPYVYSQFTKNMDEKIKKIKEDRITRNIDIVSLHRIDNTYTIDLDIYQYAQGKTLKQRQQVIIEVAYNPNRKSFNMVFANPYGLYVKKFNEAIKKE